MTRQSEKKMNAAREREQKRLACTALHRWVTEDVLRAEPRRVGPWAKTRYKAGPSRFQRPDLPRHVFFLPTTRPISSVSPFGACHCRLAKRNENPLLTLRYYPPPCDTRAEQQFFSSGFARTLHLLTSTAIVLPHHYSTASPACSPDAPRFLQIVVFFTPFSRHVRCLDSAFLPPTLITLHSEGLFSVTSYPRL